MSGGPGCQGNSNPRTIVFGADRIAPQPAFRYCSTHKVGCLPSTRAREKSNEIGLIPLMFTGSSDRFFAGVWSLLQADTPAVYNAVAGGAVSVMPAACPPRQVSTSGTVLSRVSKALGRQHD